ncbi:PBECR2 nuclease fold domain-containing protein [Gemmobacter sp.]|uniref:PBECR2 nuclease fold domain-containing protein n=1 Tax=Gemmobacter sp. TaxID=1898957 RepID=UPI002AFE1D28|nr:PBECR2 nuclease fold domain-containing protein [Gemmobacter sp.]
MQLAGLEGREAVFADGAGRAFADPDLIRQEFREQIEFLTQKRGKPTRAWTDAMHGVHDRAFVVAGATDLAMLEEFQAAIIDGARTYDSAAFAQEFDRIVEKYGWSYNGGREWRIQTIFETNIRTSYMAGRLQQMRDPDVVKARPYWQYLHADTRVPMNPRPLHLSWDGRILMWDDPWWDVYFPPNDWGCSCGVRTLALSDLRRMGREGPDPSPGITRRPYTHKASGETVMLPEGAGYGWDYMPGDHWERGLVPSAWTDDGGQGNADGGSTSGARNLVDITQPMPIEELAAKARPFTAPLLDPGLPVEAYLRAFLNPLGADIGQPNLFIDQTGARMPISELMLIDHLGRLKIGKRGREVHLARLAETILDPDEIWLGVTAKTVPGFGDAEELIVDRRYVRFDGSTGGFGVFQVGRRWWEAITVYPVAESNPGRTMRQLDRRRGGKLLWSRLWKPGRPG